MDPKACLDRAAAALACYGRTKDSDHLDDAGGALADYDEWIRKGGFAPKGGAAQRAKLGELFDELRAGLPSDSGRGDAPAYVDGGE